MLQEVSQALSSHLASAEVIQQQACIRPLSPDGSPVIGQHPYVAGAYIATGETDSQLHLRPKWHAIAEVMCSDVRTHIARLVISMSVSADDQCGVAI